MKKTNFIFIKLIFAFIFVSVPLFLSLSNAEIVANELYTNNKSAFTISNSSKTLNLCGYTPTNIAGAVKEYILNSDDTSLKPILDDLKSQGFSKSVIYIYLNGSVPSYRINIFPDEFDFDFTHIDSNPQGVSDYIGLYAPSGSYCYQFWEDRNTYWGAMINQTTNSYAYKYNLIEAAGSNSSTHFLDFNNMSVKSVTRSSGFYVWDGESYYYQSPSEPVSPTLPTNAEIAQAVQAFYNSDYYKNNKDFSDFMVLYNYDTQYFSFIGHNFGISLGQVIVPPDYEYEGYSYKQAWWKFFLRSISSELASNLWNRYYWLYSTNDFGQNITSVGKGSIKDLINLHFSTKSVIVYSTTDYRVVKIETDENGALSPVEGTIPGNQYTYDENLVPTENEYNPLENFVPVNPVDTALGNFGSSDILDIVNQNIISWTEMSWVFTSVSSLFNTFSSLLLLICVLLLISKIIGG